MLVQLIGRNKVNFAELDEDNQRVVYVGPDTKVAGFPRRLTALPFAKTNLPRSRVRFMNHAGCLIAGI